MSSFGGGGSTIFVLDFAPIFWASVASSPTGRCAARGFVALVVAGSRGLPQGTVSLHYGLRQVGARRLVEEALQ
jgi:hypothetical protein